MEYDGLGFAYKEVLKRKYIFFLGLGILALASCCFYFNERYETMTSMEKVIALKKSELKSIRIFKTQHPDIEEYKQYLQRESAASSSLLPEKYEEKEFLQSLYKFSQGVNIINVTLPTKQDVTKLKDNNIHVYYAKIQIQGDYYDILRLFKELEEHHYLLQKLKITADKTGYLNVSLSVGKYIINNK